MSQHRVRAGRQLFRAALASSWGDGDCDVGDDASVVRARRLLFVAVQTRWCTFVRYLPVPRLRMCGAATWRPCIRDKLV